MPFVNNLAAGSFTFKNTLGFSIYIQTIGVAPVGGTPNITIRIGNRDMTGSQSAASSNRSIQLDGAPLSLNNAFTYSATTQDQEIELLPGDSIVITITGGAGSVLLAGAVGIGVAN